MPIYRLIFITTVLGFLHFMGCANNPQNPTESEISATTPVDQEKNSPTNSNSSWETKAHNFVEISFNPGSSTLSEKSKTSLTSILSTARQSGKIDEVLVMSWSDQDYPSKSLKKLAKSQRALAAKRNKVIKSYVNEIKKVDVDTFNMAERPNAISKLFNTADNELKETLVSAGLPTTADSSGHASKASRAVILVKIK